VRGGRSDAERGSSAGTTGDEADCSVLSVCSTCDLETVRRFVKQQFSLSTTIGPKRVSIQRSASFVIQGRMTVDAFERATLRRFGQQLIVLDKSGIRPSNDTELRSACQPRPVVDGGDLGVQLKYIRTLARSGRFADLDQLRTAIDRAAGRLQQPADFAALAIEVASLDGETQWWTRADVFRFLDRHGNSPDRLESLQTLDSVGDHGAILRDWLAARDDGGDDGAE
jgi:hypothetical protein